MPKRIQSISDELETFDEDEIDSRDDVRELLELIEAVADVPSFPADSVVELEEIDILFADDSLFFCSISAESF